MEAIYYSAKDHRLYGLNAAGWAPASHTPEFFHQQGLDYVPFYGVYSSTVPGTVDGWSRLLDRFGRMSLAQVLQPSIETARQGLRRVFSNPNCPTDFDTQGSEPYGLLR